MSPESQARLADSLRQLNELHEAKPKDYRAISALILEIFHYADGSSVNHPVIKQLYDGSKLLTGGATEFRDGLVSGIEQGAAQLEFDDLVSGEDFPNQARFVAEVLFEFIKRQEDARPGTMTRAVALIREYFEASKKP